VNPSRTPFKFLSEAPRSARWSTDIISSRVAIRPADETPKTRKTRGPVSHQPWADVQAADQLPVDAERAAAEQQFRHRIEHELTAELRSRLHLTLSGTSATFDWYGRSFTLTYAGFVERTTVTPSGGLAAHTLRAWCITPADNQQSMQNFAEGKLQANLFDYLGIRGSP
jgi:hypothetical protein